MNEQQNGFDSGKSAVDYISNVIASNTTILHLDLSMNGFSYEESRFISNTLKNNKTLLGFHFGGNHGIIDNTG